jgi:hypothetical protein
MTICFIGGDAAHSLAKARQLAEDLAQLAKNGGPTPEQLAAAPLLHLWRGTARDSAALTGLVFGHPRLADNRPALTTELFAIDIDAGWARSWSRFYRLGQPLKDLGRTQ